MFFWINTDWLIKIRQRTLRPLWYDTNKILLGLGPILCATIGEMDRVVSKGNEVKCDQKVFSDLRASSRYEASVRRVVQDPSLASTRTQNQRTCWAFGPGITRPIRAPYCWETESGKRYRNNADYRYCSRCGTWPRGAHEYYSPGVHLGVFVCQH